MKCRCGHGRALHRPTSKGMAYAAQQRRKGRVYPTKAPCIGGNRHQYCKCRNWHPEEA